MKHFNKLILFIILSSSLLLGCKKDFFDINQNPNTVTESNITAELILPNALHNVGVQTVLGYGWLNNWMGYWSPSGSYSPNTEESTYNITGGFGEGKWDGIYNTLFDLHTVEAKAQTSDQPLYRGIAMIMKAHLFQNLVDMFGNVPYSQAFNLEVASPSYDKAEDIYKDLQVKLDTAIAVMKEVTLSSTSYQRTVDIVYHGNTQLWIKLANTLKLRLLIRQTQVPGFAPTAELAKIQANGGVLLSGESASVNPGYLQNEGKQNPFYNTFGRAVNGNVANEYYRANNYVLGILKSNTDARLSRFFQPAASPASSSNPYIGTTYGAAPDVAFDGTKTSNIGPGLAGKFDQSQWIVTSVESMFLYSEAVARGWLTGDAKTVYENAVKESFIWLGVPNAATAANDYLTTVSIANWANAGTTTDSRVRFLLLQKYIALTGINPLEAWSDYRRMGVPSNLAISINPAKISNTIPVRLLYPTGEFAVNAKNVEAEGSVNQFTTPLFWDK